MDNNSWKSHLQLDFTLHNRVTTNTVDCIDCSPRSFRPHSNLLLPGRSINYGTQPGQGSSSGIPQMPPIPVIPVSGAGLFHTTIPLARPPPTITDVLIPQRPYFPPYSDGRARVVFMAPIYFTMEDRSKFKVEPVINGVFKGFVERDVVTAFPSSSISIRIEWPGYRAWSRQIRTRDFRNPPQRITQAKLVQEIGKCLKRFVEEMQSVPIDPLYQSWRVGSVSDSHCVTIHDIAIVGIENVSKGSWQPILYRFS